MGTWTYSSGTWTLSGSAVRTARVLPQTWPAAGALRLQCARPSHNVLANILSSRDLRTGWEIGISGTDLVIQSRSLGGSPSVAASTPHGLTAGVPFTLEVRYVDGVIEAYLNGSSTAALTYATTTYSTYRHCGFSSATVGAMVLLAEVCSLIQNVSPATEMLFAACDGNLISLSGTEGPRVVKTGCFAPDKPVRMIDFEQQVYCLDGTHTIKADARTYVASLWGDASGDGVLPGALEDVSSPGDYVPGTSRMRFVTRYMARILLMADPTDPQNLWGSAIADANDWNTAKENPGHAFGTPASAYGKIGKPIIAAIEATRRVLVIGCTNAVWRMVGDPATGVPTFDKAVSDHGISGPEAMTEIGEGLIVVHSPTAGLILVPAFGSPVFLTRDVLTERGFTFPPENASLYNVQVRFEPKRQLIHTFITTVATGASTHYVYDARVGRFQAGQFGPIPVTFPNSVGPMASCVWNDKLVLGTRDGRLLYHDDSTFTDDGTVYTCRFAMQILDEGEEHHETVLHRLQVTPARNSGDVDFTVYGGLTAEQAWVGTDRWELLSGTVDTELTPVSETVRAGALVIEFENSGAENMRLEVVEVETTMGERVSNLFVEDAWTGTAPARSPDGDIDGVADETPIPPEEGPGTGGITGPVLPGIAYGDNQGGISEIVSDDPWDAIPVAPFSTFPGGGGGGGGPPEPPNPPPGGGGIDLGNHDNTNPDYGGGVSQL